MSDSLKNFLLKKEKEEDVENVLNSIKTAFKNNSRMEVMAYIGYTAALKHYNENSTFTKTIVEERMKNSNYSAFFYYGYLRAMYDKGSINLEEYKALIPYTKREMEDIL